MKLWIIALTSVIIGLVLSLAVAALLQDHVSRPVSVGLIFWVQMVWMIPFFLSFASSRWRECKAYCEGEENSAIARRGTEVLVRPNGRFSAAAACSRTHGRAAPGNR
jgi:hypothetical protein